jgi:hypothetical protein
VGRTRNPPSRRAPAGIGLRNLWSARPAPRSWSRTATAMCSSSSGSGPPWSPTASPDSTSTSPTYRSSSARPASSPRNGTYIGSWPRPTHGPRPRPPWIERLTPLAAAAATTELVSARRTSALRRRSPGVGARYRSCHRQNGRRDRSVPLAACAAEPTGAGGGPGTDHLRQRGRRLHHRPGLRSSGPARIC